MNVTVIGTGYVGLTTGVTLAFLGHQVVCLDIDAAKVARLNQGELPIYEPGLPELLSEAQEYIRFTSEYDAAGVDQADVVFVTVGTPANPDGSPDLTYARSVAQSVGERLGSRFTVIVNKSTVTEWPQYRDLPWDEIKARMRQPLVLDGRNFLPRTKLVALGFQYLGVGR